MLLAVWVPASGWLGDRFALLTTPAGDALVWITLWDSDGDADEFADAARRLAAARRPHSSSQRTGARTRFEAGSRETIVWSGTVDGRPAVLYQDQPIDTGDLFDMARVRVTPTAAPHS